MKQMITRNPVLTFVLLTLGYQFAVVGMVKLIVPVGTHLHENKTAWMIFRMRVFGPLLFVVALTAYLEGREGLRKLFGAFRHWRVPLKWYALGFGWKFLFTYVGVGVLVLVGARTWPGWVVDDFFGGDFSNLRAWGSNLAFIVGIAFVEETAWLKFCVTRMQMRYSAFASCLLIGVAWGLWYLPMLLIGEGTPDGYPWPMFLLSMVALTFLLGWTYNMTHSGVILLIMQVVSNCAFFILPVLPAWHDLDATYVNGFVVVNILSAVLIVLVYGWRELGTGRRARWDEIGKEHAPKVDVNEQEALRA